MLREVIACVQMCLKPKGDTPNHTRALHKMGYHNQLVSRHLTTGPPLDVLTRVCAAWRSCTVVITLSWPTRGKGCLKVAFPCVLIRKEWL